MSRSKSPVADRLKALDGLKIASPSAVSSYTLSLRGAAQDVGATIEFIYLAQAAMLAALESGVIDGYASGAPLYAAPLIRGIAYPWISGPRGEFPP